MATDEEIYKIIARVEGEAQVKKLASAVDDLEDQLRQSIAASGPASAATKQLGAAAADAAAQLRQAEKALQQVGGSSKSAGNFMMQAGYAVDDLQYGFRGIANNIQPILSSIPALAKFAGPISIAAIAAYQLYEHWDELATLFGQGHAKTQAEQMDELSKKTAKTADETERLAKWERERKAIAEQETTPTSAQASQTSAVNRAIIDGPVSEVDRTIKDLYGQQVRNAQDTTEIEENKRRIAVAEKQGGGGSQGVIKDAKARIAELQAAIDAKVDEWVRDFRGKIATDPKALQSFIDTLERSGKNPELAEKLRGATPEMAKARERQEQEKAETQAELKETYDSAMRDLAEKKRLDDIKKKKETKDQEVNDTVQGVQDDLAAQDRADAKEKERAAEKAEKDREAREKEQTRQAKEKNPGLEGLIRTQLKAMGGGDQAALQIAKMIAPAVGDVAAAALVNEQKGGVQGQLMMDYINGPESKHRNSQVIGSEQLSRSIQSAVGGEDIQKKQLEIQQRTYDVLVQMSQRPPSQQSRAIGFGANGQLSLQ